MYDAWDDAQEVGSKYKIFITHEWRRCEDGEI